jgi:hypothetical protein
MLTVTVIARGTKQSSLGTRTLWIASLNARNDGGGSANAVAMGSGFIANAMPRNDKGGSFAIALPDFASILIPTVWNHS